MADEYERQRHQDIWLAGMYRLDPDKLAAIRRAATGMTRCPECDALNPADQKRCSQCGARLYYDLPDDEKKEERAEGKEEEVKRPEKESRKEDDSKNPPYY